MQPMKILVVEDDRPISNLITTTLKMNGYAFFVAWNGRQAVSLCSSNKPDLILLDLGLPDIDGIEVIRTIRSWSSAVIIIISARSEGSDKIAALDAGADDYLTKPFSVDELLARIRAAGRRMQYLTAAMPESPEFINGPLRIDYVSNLVYVEGTQIHLTSNEYKLLSLLSKNVGKILTHSYIIDHIWGGGVETDIVSLRVYMASLRKKINTVPGVEDLIETHIGIGYQMVRISPGEG